MSQPIFLRQGSLQDSADAANEQISNFKMQLDNSMEHNKTLLSVIESLARCSTLIAQDNQYLNEQVLSLQQQAELLDREIRELRLRNEELEKKSRKSAVTMK